MHSEFQRKVRSNFPSSYSLQQWRLVADVITSGLCTGVWDSLSKALTFFEAYFEFREKLKEGIYETILRDTLAELSGIPYTEWATSPSSVLVEVDPKNLKTRIDSHTESGLIPKVKPDQLQLDVRALGWGVKSKGGKYIYKFIRK